MWRRGRRFIVDAKSARPLEGVTVLEAALLFPGPYCSSLLMGMGARVIKLERPGLGDRSRRRSAFFAGVNRGKQSLTLDLKQKAGREVLHRLIKGCDVFTEGFRPGVAARLGADYDTLGSLNPGLVYCSISGFGQDGPYRDLPGHDINYLSLSGMLHYLRDSRGEPLIPGVALADLSAAMFAALGIVSALLARNQSGCGRRVDVSMLDGLLSWMGPNLATFAATGRDQRRRDPGYGLFTTRDDKHLALGIAFEDWFWGRLCRAAGLEPLAVLTSEQRVELHGELVPQLRDAFARRDLADWIELLRREDVPATPVLTPGQVLDDPQVAARGMVKIHADAHGGKSVQMGFPLKFSPDAPAVATGGEAPALGQNNDPILRSLGYGESEISKMHEQGVIQQEQTFGKEENSK